MKLMDDAHPSELSGAAWVEHRSTRYEVDRIRIKKWGVQLHSHGQFSKQKWWNICNTDFLLCTTQDMKLLFLMGNFILIEMIFFS
jgi:hypothetical protein